MNAPARFLAVLTILGLAYGPAAARKAVKSKRALVVIDVQKDFVHGALTVPGGADIIRTINQLIARAMKKGQVIIYTGDGHTDDHSSFQEQGGRWPKHCVKGTPGAELVDSLLVPQDYNKAFMISKATQRHLDSYSGLAEHDMQALLKELGIEALDAVGLATDYCVKHTCLDARKLGLKVNLIADAIKAVNLKPTDGRDAIREMKQAGVKVIYSKARLRERRKQP